MSEIIIINASADVGNSSTKTILTYGDMKKARKQPTVISYLPHIPQFDDEELDVLVANLHKNMVVHINSEAISQSGLYAVGDYANITGGVGFNIRHHNKAERDITIIQPLTMLSVAAVQKEFAETGDLPKVLNINFQYAAAIPVLNYTKAKAKALEKRLIGEHVIIVYVSETKRVTVTINIVGAKVTQEGIPAFFALVNAAPSLFERYNERYGVNVTGKDFIHRKVLFADIGDGTLELIYVVDGKPVISKSRGYRLGVGHASEKALSSFKNTYNFRAEITRTNYMEKVLNPNDKWHHEANQQLQAALFEQEGQINDAIIDVIENVILHDLDDICVLGGGTNVFTELEKQLVAYAIQYKMRVLWVDGKEASLMNAIGLDELNNKAFFKK